MGSKPTPAIIVNMIIALLRLFVLELPIYLFLHPFRRTFVLDSGLSLGDRIFLFVIRRTNYLFTPATLRYVADLGLPELVLNSPRYKLYSHTLFQPFTHPGGDFRGRWIIQGSFTQRGEPQHSNIVIFYLHGGGYFSSSTACYLLFLLRLAETLTRGARRTVSIFALEYALAPEHPFPTQLAQAGAAYRWLIASHADGGAGVDCSRVLLAGDSAGGHLALSLLVDLQLPYPAADAGSSAMAVSSKSTLRPGLGLVLMSPWLSLWHEPDSFRRNEHTDVLSGWLLLEFAKWFLGPTWTTLWPPKSPYLEFVNPEPKIDWAAVLPSWVWVSAGKSEILYDDILDWYDTRKAECGSIEVDGELDLRTNHVYAWLKTMEDGPRKKLLARKLDLEASGETDDEYEAVERIGQAILGRYERVFG